MKVGDACVLGGLSATETANAVRRGEVSSRECVEAAFIRAAMVTNLNCIATLIDRDAVVTAAATARGPWSGVPTLIKDTDNWIGAPTLAGSAISPMEPARSQTPFMDAIRAGGLSVIGKSATPEFAMHLTTEPDAFNPCRNPWNTDYSAGGSSGGAAAAVAAGVVPIAHAGDAAGSIRIPAAACGVVGFKPSRGRTVSNGDDGGPAQITSQGAVARTIEDLGGWLDITRDPSRGVLNVYSGFAPANASRRRYRVGLRKTGIFPDVQAQPDICHALQAMADALERAGHRVEHAPPPVRGLEFVDAFATYWGFAAVSLLHGLTQQLQRSPVDGEIEARTLAVAAAFANDLAALPDALKTLGSAWGHEASVYERFDVILSPVTTSPTPRLGGLAWDGGDAREHILSLLRYASFTPLQNATGQPCLIVPGGFDASGLPIGLQFAASPGDDDVLLGLGFSMQCEGLFRVQWPGTHMVARAS